MVKHPWLHALCALAVLVLGAGCQPECQTTDDCVSKKGDGYVCDLRHSCVPAPTCSPACNADTPICDPDTLTCKVCTATTGCSGATPVCVTTANSGAGQCITCTAAAGCGAGTVCDTSVAGGQCVQCISNGQCGGSTPVCDLTSKTCKACITTNNAGCSGATPVCDPAGAGGQGQCIACTATAGCATGTVCDTSVAGGRCVGCLGNTDCKTAGAPICETSTQTCKACTATAGCASGFICDTTANAGNGQCVQCTSDAQCGGSTPVCDLNTKSCKACTATAGCSGATPVCSTTANNGSGQCVTCTAAAGCTGGTVCDTSVQGGQCVQCTSNAQCGGSNPVCDTASHTCKTCLASGNAGCGGTTPICVATGNGGSGQCVTCTATAGCTGGAVCDTSVAGGRCVQCTSNAQCGGSTPVCDTTSHSCKTCLSNNSGCGGLTPVCNTSGNSGAGQCVTCLADNSGCSGSKPVCDTSVTGGQCVACLDNSTCGGAAPVCDTTSHTCKTCLSNNAGCGGSTPVCNTSGNGGAGICVQCNSNATCGGATPVCDVAAHTCVGCLDNSSCGGSTPVCDTAAKVCVACLDDSSCGGSTPYCNTSSHTCKTCLGNNTGCGGATPTCDTSGNSGAGVCVVCTATGGCSGSTPTCDTTVPGGECVACTTDAQCSAFPLTPYCNTATNACVQCLTNNGSGQEVGCGGATPYCDGSTNTCKTCLTAGNAGCSSPTAACYGAGNNGQGQCVQCTDSTYCGGATALCDTGSHSCKTCLADNSGCSGSTPACNTSANGGAGACVTCSATTGCAAPNPVCDVSVPVCVECLDNSTCGGAHPYCNTGTKTCRTCLADNTGCSGTTPFCDVANDSCAVCVSDSNCSVPTGVCDRSVAGGRCVQCTSNTNCGGTTPYCNPANNTCKTCLANGTGCGGSTPVCDTSGSGGAGACVTCLADNTGCSGATPVCFTGVPGGQCVECVSNAQCTGANPVCDPRSYSCKRCLDDNSGCGGSTPICDTAQGSGAGACVVCTATQGCGGSTPICDTSVSGGQCVGCANNSQCGTLQECDPTSHTCVAPATPPATASSNIADVRAAADGPVVPSLPINGALVTYKKPALGTDPVGFFLQAEQAGPAIFVAVDPATYSLNVGDRVNLSVDALTTVGNLREVTAISNVSKVSTGHPISGLVQDVSTLDLVAEAANLESEAVKITGTIASAFGSSGTGHQQASITTAGNTTATTTLRLRVSDTVRNTLDLTQNCTFTLNYGPFWRFNTVSQPSSYNTSDFSAVDCPAPTVVSANPASGTQLVVTFDRQIDPTSVQSNGSQFTFTSGLTATAASASGNTVTLTTTLQTPDAPYTLTVANTVKDLLGKGVGTPNTATFNGYATPAVLLINEVNVNISAGHDLFELLVVSAGTTRGIVLQQQDTTAPAFTTLATLPAVNVAVGDIMVVHINPTAAGGDAPASETVSKNEYPAATYPANYDTAWDVFGPTLGTSGATYSNRVIVVKTATGTVQDAVGFFRSDLTGTSRPGAYPAILKTYQTSGQWNPPNCGGIDCAYDTGSPTVTQISVDLKTAATANNSTPAESVHRSGPDTSSKADWSAIGPSSFGLPNP